MNSINQCMQRDLQELDDLHFESEFIFPKEFIAFRGHFAKQAILPGICKIQAVVAMVSLHENKQYRLKEVVSAKYMQPVRDNEKITINCEITSKMDDLVHVKATVMKQDIKVAMLKLILEKRSVF